MSLADTLVPFGFTALESEIYVFLLRESPATGYRIAQGINKPAANTYKGIQTLQAKGAVLVEEGPSRLCRAVPLDELMNRLQKDFEGRRKQAEKQLKSIGKPIEDERVYHLRSREQIVNRMREMLGGAKSSVLLKIPSSIAAELTDTIARAAGKGATVSVVAEVAVELEAEVHVNKNQAQDQVVVVCDGKQALVGTLSDAGESEAVWTQSRFLCAIHGAGLSAEIALANVVELLNADEKRSRIRQAIDKRQNLQE